MNAMTFQPNEATELSGLFDNLFSVNPGNVALPSSGVGGSTFTNTPIIGANASGTGILQQVANGLTGAAGLLTTYWQGQQAVNAAQAAAQGAKYGSASQGAASASADLSTLTVPLLGAGAMIALALALHNSTGGRSRK